MNNLNSTKALFLKTIESSIDDLEQEKNEKKRQLTKLLIPMLIIEILIFGIFIFFQSFILIALLLSTIAIYIFIDFRSLSSKIANIEIDLERLEKSKKIIEKVKSED